MPRNKLTKASGYWLFMHELQKNMGHRGPFRPFAARWDHLWLEKTAGEKQEWKDRAQTVKQELGEYSDRYVPLDRALKKYPNDSQETERLIQERIHSIHRILDQTT